MVSLHEKCQNAEYFLVCIDQIQSPNYVKLYPVRIQENTGKKILRIQTLGIDGIHSCLYFKKLQPDKVFFLIMIKSRVKIENLLKIYTSQN